MGASADLQAVAAEIKKHVRALDGMVRYRFGDNAELMGAWRSVRNPSLRSGQVVLGPFKSRAEPGPSRAEVRRLGARASSNRRRDGGAGGWA